MAQEHLDRLSAVDAGFLAQESDTTHMHIGGVLTFEGPSPAIDELLGHVESRLHLVPRYRQKLAFPPLDTGRPVWIDDPTFNLSFHVRHAALPPPGGERALLDLAARIFSQPLDRTKPLWELWLVEGLASGGFAMLSKTHHAMVDGISGVDLMSVLFDQAAGAAGAHGAPSAAGDGDGAGVGAPWIAQPSPSAALLAATGLVGTARTLAVTASNAVGAVSRPQEVLAQVRDVAEGIGDLTWLALHPPPEAPFNVAPGPHRRIAVVRARLDEFRAVKQALGGTVNDVVLAIVAGALGAFLRSRGRRTDGVELRAGVPVSLRTGETPGALGNQLTQLLAPLPVSVTDPVQRLARVREFMSELKTSKQALGAKAIAGAQGFAAPTILAQASRMNFSDRFYNLLVTNVPGPQKPIHVLGRRLEAVYPVAFLAGRRALAVAIMSYDGAMNFGLIADYDALPDLDVIADGIREALAELGAAAAGQPASAGASS